MATGPEPQTWTQLQLMRRYHGNHPPSWIIIDQPFWILISRRHFEFRSAPRHFEYWLVAAILNFDQPPAILNID